MYPIEQILNELDQKTAALWALDCAERVLFYFNDLFPEDPRPADAIAAGLSWVRGEADADVVLKSSVAAHNAAREVVDVAFSLTGFDPLTEGVGAEAAACTAARAAGQAAAAARSAGHAPHAATYALKAVSYGEGTDEAVKKERKWQYQRLLEIAGRI
ncbi:MAG: hypothetical protein LBU81_02290 [Methanosarcinales archaeon]|jgi:hypothetical protein|nr:hypothetical protein [Methanosarcinales archaeon]